MERITLLETLRRVTPALSGKDFVPVFACFCFDGKKVITYDDQVALTADCAWVVKGAIRGSVLLGWLEAARGADVEVEQDDSQVSLKAGRSKLKLPVIPEKDFVYKAPTKPGDELKFTPELLEALDRCAISMGRDPSRPWQAGLTMIFGDEKATIYSTNNVSGSMAIVKMKKPEDNSLSTILLPPKFVELTCSIGAKDSPKTLTLGKGWVTTTFASGLQLFSRTAADHEADNFKQLFSPELREAMKTKTVEIPKGMTDALTRALVVLSGAREKVTKVTVKDGKLILVSVAAGAAEVRDTLKLPGHEDIEVEVGPEPLKAGLEHAASFGILDDSHIAFTGPGFRHVIAVIKDN